MYAILCSDRLRRQAELVARKKGNVTAADGEPAAGASGRLPQAQPPGPALCSCSAGRAGGLGAAPATEAAATCRQLLSQRRSAAAARTVRSAAAAENARQESKESLTTETRYQRQYREGIPVIPPPPPILLLTRSCNLTAAFLASNRRLEFASPCMKSTT